MTFVHSWLVSCNSTVVSASADVACMAVHAMVMSACDARKPQCHAGDQWIDPDFATSSPADAAAGAVACRGYMWANQHPAPSAWRPLRAPLANMVARATAQNRAELAEQAANGQLRPLEAPTLFAIQVVPFARLMCGMWPGHPARMVLPLRWRRVWQGAVHEESGGGVLAAPVIGIGTQVAAVEEADDIED
jgi:hypothetical protein